MKLSALVAAYLASPPVGVVLAEAQIARCLKKAVRFYCGVATLTNAPSGESQVHSPIDATDSIEDAQDFDLTASEYALIRPLFDLYVELENAASLEAARALGLEVYGRATSEIYQDISARESEMPRLAFFEPVTTI